MTNSRGQRVVLVVSLGLTLLSCLGYWFWTRLDNSGAWTYVFPRDDAPANGTITHVLLRGGELSVVARSNPVYLVVTLLVITLWTYLALRLLQSSDNDDNNP